MTRHKTITPERYEREKEPVALSPPGLSCYQRYSKIVSDSTRVRAKSRKLMLISGDDPAPGGLRLFYSSGCALPRQQARSASPPERGEETNKEFSRFGFDLPLATDNSNSGTCRINDGFKVDCLPDMSQSYILSQSAQYDCQVRGCCYDNTTGNFSSCSDLFGNPQK